MSETQIGPTMEQDARLGIGGNLPPSPIDPKKLIDPEILPALLAENYPALIERGRELEAAALRWKERFLVPRPEDYPEGKSWPTIYRIPDEGENQATADFLRQLSSFAGGPLDRQGNMPPRGEVDEARQKVKRAPFDACRVIDAWFNALRLSICQDASIMDRAQTVFLQEKVAAERRKREAVAEAAEEEARRAAQVARDARGDDEAVAVALAAEETAEEAWRAAAAPVTTLAKSTSAAGTTTSLRSNWVFEVVDLAALVKAVADGKAPSNFLTVNEPVVRAMIKAEKGTRAYPGLSIKNDAKANRTGRTA